METIPQHNCTFKELPLAGGWECEFLQCQFYLTNDELKELSNKLPHDTVISDFVEGKKRDVFVRFQQQITMDEVNLLGDDNA